MYLFNSFKNVYWTNLFVTIVFTIDTSLSQDKAELRKLFVEFGFTIKNNISLNIDLPYWGQQYLKVEQDCQSRNTNVSTKVQFYNQGVEDAIEFLCDKDNLREYQIQIKCFNSTKVAKIFNTCQTWREIAINNFNSSNILDLNVTQCSIEDVYQACTLSMLQSLKLCGKNASKWFDTWWRKMNYYYHLSISCVTHSDSKSNNEESDEWSIILGIILAVTACLLVVGIIVFVVFLFSRRKYNNGDDDSSHPRGPRGFGQRREVPPPYALVVDAPGENAGETDAGNGALRLVDRENRITAEMEARLYDGNVTGSTGNGLILPPLYSGSGPPPDFETRMGVANVDSDKEDELMSLETGTTRCSSVNLQAADSILNIPVHLSTNQTADNQPTNHEARPSSRRGSLNSPTEIPKNEIGFKLIKNPSLPSVNAICSSQERSMSSLV